MDSSTARERAGIYASYLLIVSYVLIGFVQYIVNAALGVDIQFDQAWAGAMNGLAGGAVGYVIGKQSTNAPGSATVNVPVQVTAAEPKQP